MRRLSLLLMVLLLALGSAADAVSGPEEDCAYFEERRDHWNDRMEEYGIGGENENPELFEIAFAAFRFWRGLWLDNDCGEIQV